MAAQGIRKRLMFVAGGKDGLTLTDTDRLTAIRERAATLVGAQTLRTLPPDDFDWLLARIAQLEQQATTRREIYEAIQRQRDSRLRDESNPNNPAIAYGLEIAMLTILAMNNGSERKEQHG